MSKTITSPVHLRSKLEGRNPTPASPNPAWSNVVQLNRLATNSKTYGDNIPDWKAKIRSKLNATTTLAVDAERLVADSRYAGQFIVDRRWNATGALSMTTETRGHLGSYSAFPGLPTISETRANNQALMAFVNDCIEAQTSFQGGVFLGELKETLSFLRRPGMGIRRLLRNYLTEVRDVSRRQRRMSRRRRLRVTMDAASSTWLETQFALRPLLSDMEGISDALWSQALRQPTKVVRGRGQDFRKNAVRSDVANVGLVSILRKYDDIEECQIKYYGAVKCQTGASGDRQHLGVLPRDFVPTIYELIPYSWLVDYFSNLGEIVRAVCFNKTDVAWMNRGSKMRRYFVLTSVSHTLATPPSGYSHTLRLYVPPGKYLCERLVLSRAPYTESLVPSLEGQLPFGRQWLNITALVAQGRNVERFVRR